MKFSLRLTLLTILLVLIGTTVLVIASISYRQAQFTAGDLAGQLLDQTEARIDLKIDGLLQQAGKVSATTETRLRLGRLKIEDFPAIIGHTQDVMEIDDALSGFFIGLESTGESAGVTRLSGKPSVWETHQSKAGAYEASEFWLGDYPQRPFATDVGSAADLDIRKRPWYAEARRVGIPIWTDAFVFLGVRGSGEVHGVTFATPIYGAGGALRGVLAADFQLQSLCAFLRALELPRGAFAFVIEHIRQDGSRRVLAHPRDDLLMRTKREGSRTLRELTPPEEFPDPLVRAFAAERLHALGRWDARPAGSTRFFVDGEAYLATMRPVGGESAPPWVICAILPESEILGRVEQNFRVTCLIGVVVLAVAALVCMYVAAQVSKPLEKLADEAHAIGRLEFIPRPVVHSIVREVDRLGVAVEDMKGGLRSFQKYVPTDLVHSFLSSGREAVFGGERRMVSIFFSDIVDFTSIAEDLSPEELVELLREYLNAISGEIAATGGTVDKYIGDSVMAFWGAPALNPGHAAAACLAAIRCQTGLQALNARWSAEGKPLFHTRIGVHSGEVVVGNIGSDARLNYTVIGDAVNLASRLEGLNKYYGTAILISDDAYQAARPAVVARPLDYVAVKGKRRSLLVHELLGLRGERGENEQFADLCEQALDRYRGRDWNEAIRLFEAVLELRADDVPATQLLTRCRAYQNAAPGAEWDGVQRQRDK